MTVGLGMPQPRHPMLAPRRATRQLMVGNVGVGSDHPVSVQSMCTTKTHDVNSIIATNRRAAPDAPSCGGCPRQRTRRRWPNAWHSQIR